MPSPIFISRPPPGFSVLAVIRGIQLTVLGAIRALRNPYLIESGYYRHAFKAVAISLIIQFVLWLPLGILTLIVRFLALFALSPEATTMFSNLLESLSFIEDNVLNIGPLVITASRYFLPEMDEMFLMSLKFVDQVYKKKHPKSHREYYPPLVLRPSIEKVKWSVSLSPSPKRSPSATPKPISSDTQKLKQTNTEKVNFVNRQKDLRKNIHMYVSETKRVLRNRKDLVKIIRNNKPLQAFLIKSFKRAGVTMGLYLLSFVPVVGSLVLPVVSFSTFNSVVGTPTAVAIFGIGYNLPRRWMVKFLGTFWGGRSLLRELLAPYFNRLPYSKSEREHWFRAREGIMFGFGAVFYLFIRIPFIGIVAYGIAQASTAYLITKVTEPPPPPPGTSLASNSPAASGFTSLASAGFVAETTHNSGPNLHPASATGSSSHLASRSEEYLVGSHAAEERWMRRDLSWTHSDKFLSGISLDNDGFGDAFDIVPGAWALNSAEKTATELNQDADLHGYNLTPSPSIHSLSSMDSDQPSGPGAYGSIGLKNNGTPRSHTPPSTGDNGYLGFSNYEKYNNFSKNVGII